MAKLDTQNWRDQYDQMRKKWKKLYDERRPVLEDYENKARESLDELMGETLPAVRDMYRESAGMRKVTEEEFLPGAKEYMQKAREYDTPERRMQASQEAMADVDTAAEASRQGAMQRLESYGIDPSMTRGAALDQNIRLQTALEKIKQGRQAATGVEERGQAYLRDALGLGAGIQTAGVNTAATASNMANATTDAASRTASTFSNIYGTPVQNLEARRALIDSSLAAKTTEANFKAAQSDGSPIAGIAGTAGMIGGAVLGSYVLPGIGTQMGAQLGAAAGGAAGQAAGGGASRQAAGSERF